MKFRRKSADPAPEEASGLATSAEDAPEDGAGTGPSGPRDFDEIDDDLERLDLGALLLEPVEGMEVRLQVDAEETAVQAVMLANEEGAAELRAFAAPRGGDLWSEVRPRIAAEYAQRGGTASEREGRFGTELECRLTVRTEDGRTGTQVSRVLGVNGTRWLLRVTLLGRPAVEPESEGPWMEALDKVVVRRGSQAMPVGAELRLAMPPRADRA